MLVEPRAVERGRYAAAGAAVCQAEGVKVKLNAVEAKHIARAIGRNAAEFPRMTDWSMDVQGYVLFSAVRRVLSADETWQYAEEGRAMHADANTNKKEGKS